jgi:hypothetical protein
MKVEGMARFPFSEAKFRVGTYMNKMNDHLVKLIMWGDGKTANHWTKEIIGFFKNAKDVKISLPTRTQLTKQEYMNEMDTLGYYDSFCTSYYENEKLIKKQKPNFELDWCHDNWTQISQYISEFYHEMSDELAAKGKFERAIAIGQINILINRLNSLKAKTSRSNIT